MNPNERKASEGYWFALGKQTGRKELADEILALLQIDERIAAAIEQHERAIHDID